uniref:Uncharacterized protein n=1 Tax=Cannabis sativa TaxID=3483 RepID=A0A803NRS4_CANSA
MFLWRVYKSWLPTGPVLTSRGMKLDPFCSGCGYRDETVPHALWCFLGGEVYGLGATIRDHLGHVIATEIQSRKGHFFVELAECIAIQIGKSKYSEKNNLMRAPKRPIHAVSTWVRRQPPKVKAFLAVISGMTALVLLRFIVHDHDNLFVAAEAVHSIGISVLIYKLMKEKTCAGLSLKSQELTAIFLAVRLYCSFVMEYDIHTLLDLATLGTTLWVIFMIRFKLKSSYMEDKDNFAIYYVVVPCAVLALLIHPSTSHHLLNRIFWAFCVYLEAVSVLPQSLNHSRLIMYLHWVLRGFRYPRPVARSSRIRTVALYGSYLRNCSNFHLGRFLLLLCEERFWRTACSATALRSGVNRVFAAAVASEQQCRPIINLARHNVASPCLVPHFALNTGLILFHVSWSKLKWGI